MWYYSKGLVQHVNYVGHIHCAEMDGSTGSWDLDPYARHMNTNVPFKLQDSKGLDEFVES